MSCLIERSCGMELRIENIKRRGKTRLANKRSDSIRHVKRQHQICAETTYFSNRDWQRLWRRDVNPLYAHEWADTVRIAAA